MDKPPFGDFDDTGLKINEDLDNRKEGPHYDILTDLREETGGVEKVRITPDGDVLGGETNIGKKKIDW